MFEDVIDRIKTPENPQNERLACLLLLDTSGSMGENEDGANVKFIDKLNNGLIDFKTALEQEDEYIRKSVDIAIVTFGETVKVVQEFQSFSTFNPPKLIAEGRTPMKEAIEMGLDLIANKKNEYRSIGLLHKRPWVFLISDGLPTDMEEGDSNWIKVNTRIVSEEKGRHFSFFAFGVSPQATETLQSLTQGSMMPATYIVGANYHSFFVWLSATLTAGVKVPTGEKMPLLTHPDLQIML